MTISGGDGNDKIINEDGLTVSIDAGAGNDYIGNCQDGYDVQSVTINGSADNDTIINEECYGISINGGTGDDSIVNDGEYGGGHDVTIVGGSGEGCDTVDNSGNEVTISTGAGMDSIENDGDEASIIAGDGKEILAFPEFAGEAIDLRDFEDAIKLDASDAAKGLKLTGNDLDNTLTGLAYDDTLTGGEGEDVFVYTGGKDVITDYTAGTDKIAVDSEPSVSISQNGNAVINVGANSLTLKKLADENPVADGKAITFVNGASETTKIYFTNMIVSGDSVTLIPFQS